MNIPEGGFLLLNKPAGLTSFECLKKLRKILNRKDLGHGGTLDCFATGILPVFWGEALKFTRYFLESYPTLPTYWKTYEAVLKLGAETDTLDPTGEFIKEAFVPEFSDMTLEGLQQLLLSNTYFQKPPQFSAKKIEGKRASDLVRQGQVVELNSVACTLKELLLKRISSDEVQILVTCSKGTYIRVLGQDIARKLNTVGHLTRLTRLACGPYSMDNSVTLEALESGQTFCIYNWQDFLKILLPLSVNENQSKGIINGNKSTLSEILQNQYNNIYCLYSKTPNIPLAIVEKNTEQDFNIHRVFSNKTSMVSTSF